MDAEKFAEEFAKRCEADEVIKWLVMRAFFYENASLDSELDKMIQSIMELFIGNRRSEIKAEIEKEMGLKKP